MKRKKEVKNKLPIKHWSHSSLMAFLRNPLAWYKRYVEEIYDTPRTPASIVGSAGHVALENFYSGMDKNMSIKTGIEYIRSIPDSEIDFGRTKTKSARKSKRVEIEKDYLQAISFYLEKPPKHKVLGVEVKGVASVSGLPIPIKAVSDLVIVSKDDKNAVDIVDHKFVSAFSKSGAQKSIFAIQAIFNYYTVKEIFGKQVHRFIVYECKKTKNADGSKQVKKYVMDFKNLENDFLVFHRLINDATTEISRQRKYLPNPSDMFEGENSFDIYRLGLLDE